MEPDKPTNDRAHPDTVHFKRLFESAASVCMHPQLTSLASTPGKANTYPPIKPPSNVTLTAVGFDERPRQPAQMKTNTDVLGFGGFFAARQTTVSA